MKIILIFLIFFGLAGGIMFYASMGGGCPGGLTFASEAICQRTPGHSEATCRDAFATARRKASEFPAFPDQSACQMQFERCTAHGTVVGGFVPVPRTTCVGGSRSGEPIYERIGQRIGAN
jgi:hypothetical protein